MISADQVMPTGCEPIRIGAVINRAGRALGSPVKFVGS